MPVSIGTFLKDEDGDEFVVSNIEVFVNDGSPASLQVFIYARGIMAEDGSNGTMGRACCLTPAQINQGIWTVVDGAEAMKRLIAEPNCNNQSKTERDNKTRKLFKQSV